MSDDLTPAQIEAQEWARDFAARFVAPKALAIDKDPHGPLRDELVREGAKAGMLSFLLPEALGGSGGDIFAGILVTEQIARACSGAAVLFGATGLGLAPLMLSGNFALLQELVPPLVATWDTDAPKLAALAATEADMGSDIMTGDPAARMGTRATRVEGGYKLDGNKVFISNGSLAGLVTVFATTDRSRPIRESWCCFAVTDDTPGFAVGQVFDKMGQRAAPAVELVFDDAFVPESHRVVPEGYGWQLTNMIMAVTRAPVGAIALGIATAAYEKAIEYAEVRVQGGKPIVQHQAVALMLADMAIRVEAARALVYKAGRAIAAGRPSIKASSMAKAYAADAAVANALDAIQVLGGNGYMHEFGVEKLLRDAKLTQIYEGTNQMNRLELVEAITAERGSSG